MQTVITEDGTATMNNQQPLSPAAYRQLVEQVTERVWRMLQEQLRQERERGAARRRR